MEEDSKTTSPRDLDRSGRLDDGRKRSRKDKGKGGHSTERESRDRRDDKDSRDSRGRGRDRSRSRERESNASGRDTRDARDSRDLRDWRDKDRDTDRDRDRERTRSGRGSSSYSREDIDRDRDRDRDRHKTRHHSRSRSRSPGAYAYGSHRPVGIDDSRSISHTGYSRAGTGRDDRFSDGGDRGERPDRGDRDRDRVRSDREGDRDREGKLGRNGDLRDCANFKKGLCLFGKKCVNFHAAPDRTPPYPSVSDVKVGLRVLQEHIKEKGFLSNIRGADVHSFAFEGEYEKFVSHSTANAAVHGMFENYVYHSSNTNVGTLFIDKDFKEFGFRFRRASKAEVRDRDEECSLC